MSISLVLSAIKHIYSAGTGSVSIGFDPTAGWMSPGARKDLWNVVRFEKMG